MVTFFNIVYRYFKLTPGDVVGLRLDFSGGNFAQIRGLFPKVRQNGKKARSVESSTPQFRPYLMGYPTLINTWHRIPQCRSQ